MKNIASAIMAIGAHHDDNELVAGALAKHKNAGWHVVSVVMTDGRYALGKSSEENIQLREKESLDAAALLGMECEFMHLPEGNVYPLEETRNALTNIIRKHQPAIVITHPAKDYHIDHMNTSRSVLEAVYSCESVHGRGEYPPCPKPFLYYSDAWFTPFEPDEYVDISNFINLKLDMLRCHKSQIPPDWVEDDNMVGHAKLQSRTRGIEAGIKYAEAFRFVPLHARLRVSNLLGEK
ncbi:MAG: hypothetical protein UT30_C0004G0012 [Candidatus Uhrbacteria bacterium GW2011_GWF2_39_13]|uniref:LmbE family protein n=1 Tax=Candidatus Uhrbacteria bacterium GW2011_GWF2_39_13 TaxID=1618995 RepID=A0A0G0ML22_9BACT|nr:MAG: hypothetical protein UT30_C0004G0012 [Candidatus Uhrbacteria bacterium GW2011_GWF2_39_13]